MSLRDKLEALQEKCIAAQTSLVQHELRCAFGAAKKKHHGLAVLFGNGTFLLQSEGLEYLAGSWNGWDSDDNRIEPSKEILHLAELCELALDFNLPVEDL